MSKLIIDMSGRGGLAPRFFGDINRTVATPELRYIGNDNQFADGVFNPFRRFGYMSPANDTFTAVTNYVPTTLTTTLGSSNAWQYAGIVVQPVSTVLPAISGTPTSGTVTGSVNSLTISTTVSSDSNRLLTVFAFSQSTAATSATFGGVPMTLVSSGNAGTGWAIFTLVNPATSTDDVVVNWALANANVSAVCIVTKDSLQSTPTIYGANNGSSTTASLTLSPSFNKGLMLGGVCSIAATHTQASGQTELFNFLTTAGSLRTSASSKTAINSSVFGSVIYDDINDDHYWGERGINIMKGDGLDDLSLSSVLALPTNSVITDLEIYQINLVRKLFYTYKNSSTNALGVGIATLPFASNDNSWLTSTVSGAFSNTTLTNPFIRKADNGFAYLFQDNVLHKIDGTAGGGANGTITANVLTFPIFFQLIDAVDYRGKMLMGIIQRNTDLSSTESINFNSECGVYVWDRQSTQVSMSDYIPLNGVKEIRKIYISPTGTVRMICVASDRIVQIREYNNSTFQIIEELPPGSYPLFHDSLSVVHTMTFWLGNDGYFYGHGSPTNGEKEAIFKIGYPALGGGVILFGGSNGFSSTSGYRSDFEAFYLSLSETSFVKWFYNTGVTPGGIPQATNTGNVYTLVKYLPKLSTVNFIRIFGAPSLITGSSNVASIKIYFNQSSTPWATKSITRDQWSRGYMDIPINKPYVNAIQLEVEFNNSQVIGTSDFAPAYAEVDYSATETNK